MLVVELHDDFLRTRESRFAADSESTFLAMSASKKRAVRGQKQAVELVNRSLRYRRQTFDCIGMIACGDVADAEVVVLVLAPNTDCPAGSVVEGLRKQLKRREEVRVKRVEGRAKALQDHDDVEASVLNRPVERRPS